MHYTALRCQQPSATRGRFGLKCRRLLAALLRKMHTIAYRKPIVNIALLPHLDEMYIRRYDTAHAGHAWPPSVVDIPMTLRIGESNFYLTCRRDVDGAWVAFCNARERTRLLACFFAHRPHQAEALMQDVLRRAAARIRAVVSELPEPLTRRDAMERMIRAGDIRTLLSRALPVRGTSIRLCCMPTLELVVVVWSDVHARIHDARVVSHVQWRVLGPRIETMLAHQMDSALQQELMRVVYPEGLPPSLVRTTAVAE